MRRPLQAFVLALAMFGVACTSKTARMAPRAGLVDLNVNLEPLQHQFESDRDFPRAVVLLSPT